MRKLLIIALGILAVPLSAYPQKQIDDDHSNGITNGVSVSYLSLPFERYESLMDKQFRHQGKGWGINYDISIPVFSPRVRLMTGIGFSHVLYNNDSDDPSVISVITKYYNSSFESLEDDYILKKHGIEYMYLSVPVNVGYKLLDKKGFTVTPYFGVAMKFNLRFVEKNQIDSNSWLDSYINVFDSNLYESDAKRILFQYDVGLEIGYRHFYGLVRYEHDFYSLFNDVKWGKDYKILCSRHGFETIHDWRFGLGYRF